MAYDIKPIQEESKKIVDWFLHELSLMRTNRANPVLIDNLQAEAYGTKQPLSHLGSISVDDPRTLRVEPWDKSLLKTMEGAILSANLGVSCVSDGKSLRVGFPELTTERRSLLAKHIREKLEQARVRVRQEREKTWNDIQKREKEKSVSEDEKFKLKDSIQKVVDETNKKLEDMGALKEKEIMQ